MNWNDLVEKITPYIVKIETPDGHGTGFLCLYNDDHNVCGVATARHVVEHADRWQQPVRLVKPRTGEFHFAKEAERVIFLDDESDSAVILFFASSGKSVGDGERQRAVSARNRRNFLQVESKDLC